MQQLAKPTTPCRILIGVHLFHLQHMVQAGVGAFPTAPGFPPAGGAQTSGGAPGSAANAVVANTSDGSGLSSMVAKNAAVVAAAAAAAAAHAAQDSQLQHHMKQQEANNGAGLATHSQVAVVGTQVGFRRDSPDEQELIPEP